MARRESEQGNLRITGGDFRGRPLHTPPGKILRPMRSQVRQALFNVLGPDVREARVLDLFSGSGCLGLEALSRGAEHAVLVERAGVCIRAIEQNLATLGAQDRATVRRHDLNLGVASLVREGPFDLVLSHPPFELLGRSDKPSQSLDVAALLRSLPAQAGLLTPGATLAFETPRGCYPESEVAESLAGLEIERRKDYGSTTLFVTRALAAAEGETEEAS